MLIISKHFIGNNTGNKNYKEKNSLTFKDKASVGEVLLIKGFFIGSFVNRQLVELFIPKRLCHFQYLNRI